MVQPKFLKDRYELSYEDNLIGTLGFPKVFSTNAVVSVQGKEWEIKKESFWKGILGIHQPGYEEPFARYVPESYKKSEITFPKGDYLTVRRYFFKSAIEFIDDRNNLIAIVSSKSGFKKKYIVELLQKHKLLDENPWVVFLGCYLTILREKRAHAAAG